jgi:hypothetical protein
MVLQEGNVRLRPLDLSKDLEQALVWYRDPEVLYYPAVCMKGKVFKRRRPMSTATETRPSGMNFH